MLCTKCSAPVQPIVCFDIDGTMGKYHEHFLTFAAEYLGYSTLIAGKDLYDGSVPFRTWFCDVFNTDVRTFRDIKLAYRQGAQKRSMEVQRWARVATRLAHDCGAEVWITTTRPYMRLDNIDPDTRFWLRRHSIYYDYMIYGDHKYEELANQVQPYRVCFVLEDLAEQIEEAQSRFGAEVPYMYCSPWNQATQGSYQGLKAGEEIILKVEERIDSWKTAHS